MQLFPFSGEFKTNRQHLSKETRGDGSDSDPESLQETRSAASEQAGVLPVKGKARGTGGQGDNLSPPETEGFLCKPMDQLYGGSVKTL